MAWDEPDSVTSTSRLSAVDTGDGGYNDVGMKARACGVNTDLIIGK